jgi:hypothetical protein
MWSTQDIENALSDNDVSEILENNKANLELISIKSAFENLSQVGEQLQQAHAKSKSLSCRLPIIKALIYYRNIVEDSLLANFDIISSSKEVLNFHQTARRMAQDKNIFGAVENIAKCGNEAYLVSNEYHKLIDGIDSLSEIARKALLESIRSQNNSVFNENIEKKLNTLIIEDELITSQTVEFENNLQEEEKNEIKALKDIASNQGEEIKLTILTEFMAPLTVLDRSKTQAILKKSLSVIDPDIIEVQASQFSQKIDALVESRNQYREKLDKLLEDINDPQNTFECANILKNTLINLYKVKVAFEKSKVFWATLKTHNRALLEFNNLSFVSEKMTKKFNKALTLSALTWMAITYLNDTAFSSIKTANTRIYAIINNLWT